MTDTHENSIEQAAPDLLTIKEAGAVMRVGRSKAYDLARRYLATGGVDGLPVRRIGNQLRAPRALVCRYGLLVGSGTGSSSRVLTRRTTAARRRRAMRGDRAAYATRPEPVAGLARRT